MPSSTQWNGGIQIALPWSTVVDVEYVGQHGYNIVEGDRTSTPSTSARRSCRRIRIRRSTPTTPGATSVPTDQMRGFRGYSAITQNVGSRLGHASLAADLVPAAVFARPVVRVQRHDRPLQPTGSTAARLQHNPDGSVTIRADQAEADALFQTPPTRHTMKANFVWDLPDLKSDQSALRVLGYLINDWQFSGVWTASTGNSYTVGANYQSGGGNVNLTGSPDYGARVRIVGDPGQGCSSDIYRQFNTAAFQGPLVGSVGLESGNDYLKGCFAQRAGPVDCPEHPAAEGPQHPAAGRPVQRPESGRHHRPEHHDEPAEPDQSERRSPTCPFDATGQPD